MSNPIPSGTIGRTDMGVDISASPGAPIYDPVPGVSRLVGRISNWYNGQPYQWYKVLTGKFKGRYWYGGEQIDFNNAQTVSQGQQIGTYAQSGTATEFGWAAASGATLAQAQGNTGGPGHSNSPAGQDFVSQIINQRGARYRKSGYSTVNVPNYVPKQYVPWVRSAAQQTRLPARVVAAQIQDESGFDPNSTSPTNAQGIAQFEPPTWKVYGKGNPYNPNDALGGYVNYMNALLKQYNGNIRNALAAYNAGPHNIAAGYGYADNILSAAGVPQSSTAGGTTAATGAAPIVRPGGQSANQPAGQSVNDIFSAYEQELQTPRTAPQGFVSLSQAGWSAPFQWWWQSFSSNYQNENG